MRPSRPRPPLLNQPGSAENAARAFLSVLHFQGSPNMSQNIVNSPASAIVPARLTELVNHLKGTLNQISTNEKKIVTGTWRW